MLSPEAIFSRPGAGAGEFPAAFPARKKSGGAPEREAFPPPALGRFRPANNAGQNGSEPNRSLPQLFLYAPPRHGEG